MGTEVGRVYDMEGKTEPNSGKNTSNYQKQSYFICYFLEVKK